MNEKQLESVRKDLLLFNMGELEPLKTIELYESLGDLSYTETLNLGLGVHERSSKKEPVDIILEIAGIFEGKQIPGDQDFYLNHIETIGLLSVQGGRPNPKNIQPLLDHFDNPENPYVPMDESLKENIPKEHYHLRRIIGTHSRNLLKERDIAPKKINSDETLAILETFEGPKYKHLESH